MSQTSHPIPRTLNRYADDDAKLLATVMGLPLVDGIFPALVLAGAISSVWGMFEVGIVVFGGSATLAVILTEMSGSRADRVSVVLGIGVGLVTLATLEATLAPTIASVLNMVVFERFAALVIAAVAAKTASARIGDFLPSPGVIVALGFLASVDPSGAALVFHPDPVVVASAAGAAVVGTGFALAVALIGPSFKTMVDVERFRFGGALALGLLSLSILGFPVAGGSLAVIGVTAVLSIDPSRGKAAEETTTASSEGC